MQELIQAFFSPNNIWSVVIRGLIWLAIAIIIIIASDSPNPQQSLKNLKSTLGFFLFFLVLSGTLIYLLFSFAPTQG